MKLLIATFFYSIGSALIPVLNLEVYLGAVAAKLPDLPDVWLALIAAAGQMVGKTIWYYAGVHTMRIPWMRRKMDKPKWQASYAKWHDRFVGRPHYAAIISLASAASGFPPYAVIAVLAGSLRMHLGLFLATGLAGRWLRFWLVLAGVGLFAHHG